MPAEAGEAAEQVVAALRLVAELAHDVVVEARHEDRRGRGVGRCASRQLL